MSMTKTKKKTSKKKCPICQKTDKCKICDILGQKAIELKKKLSKLSKRNAYYLVGLIALGVIFYNYRAQFIVATVNGQPIFRTTLIKELEKQAAQKALDNLITKTLIIQEGKKQAIVVSPEDIETAIKEIEQNLLSQNQDLDQLLSQRGMQRNDLAEEIKLQKIVEQLVVSEASVSDEEVDEAFEQRKQFLPTDLTEEEAKTGVRQQLEEQKNTEAVQVWLEQIRQSASINYLLFPQPLPVVNQ